MRRYFVMLYAIFALLLAGCETIGKALPTISFDSDPKASELTMTLSTDEFVNTNLSGEPTPIEIQIIHLSEDSKLDSLYYEEVVSEDLSKVLGKSYVNHQDYNLTPDQLKILPKSKIKEDTHYLAVIAHFSDPEKTEWYKIIPVEGMGKKYHILVRITDNGINIQKDEK